MDTLSSLPEHHELLSVEEAFDAWAEHYDNTSDLLIQVEGNTLLKLLDNPKKKKILDLGAGTGRYTLPLLKQSAEVTALDISEKMLEILKKNCPVNQKHRLHCVKADISAGKLPKQYFDMAISGLMFDHLKEISSAFKAVAQSLKSGSSFTFSVYSPFKDPSLAGPRIKLENRTILIPTYQHHLEEYFYHIKKNSFTIEEIREPKVSLRQRLFYNNPSFRQSYGRPLLLVFKVRKN